MMHGSLPARLQVLRARQGLTLIEAAEKIGIGRDTLSDLERGNRHPVMPTLAKIAKGYGVPVEDLLEEPVPFDDAPRGAGQTSAAEAAEMIEGLAATVDSVADRTQRRSEQTDETDDDALTALLEDVWLAQRGAEQLLGEVNEEAVERERETPGERRARSKLEGAVMRLTDLAENIASGLLELEGPEEERGKLYLWDEELRRRRVG